MPRAPWTFETVAWYHDDDDGEEHRPCDLRSPEGAQGIYTEDCGDYFALNPETAEFICTTRNNLPALLDRLEAAEALIVEAAPYVSRCASNEECLDSYAARMSENEDVPKMEALASRMYAFGGEPPEEGSDGD